MREFQSEPSFLNDALSRGQFGEVDRSLQPFSFMKPKELHQSVTIDCSPNEVFDFWRNFENLPRFMKDIAQVEVLSAEESHWMVKLQSGASVEWNAAITDERPGAMIAWRSLEGSEVDTEGAVWFSKAPANLGTEVQLMMTYRIPGGELTELATLFTDENPACLTLTNLRRLKALLETGEIPTIEGQPSGREEIQIQRRHAV